MLRQYVNIVRWYRSPLAMLEKLSAKHGSSFALQIPRQEEPMVIFAEPAAVKRSVDGDPNVLRRRRSERDPALGARQDSLLVLDGDRHLRERRLMLPPFHGDRMKRYGDAMRDVDDARGRALAGRQSRSRCTPRCRRSRST